MARRVPLSSLPPNLRTGLQLLERGYYLRHGGKVPPSNLPEKVLDFLNRLEQEGIDWALVGAEAINLHHGNPRATVDVDIVVRSKHIPKIRKVLRETCARVEDSEVHLKGTLSPPPVELTIDVIKSQSHPLFEEALDHKIEIQGLLTPRLEALLALKFLSVVSPWRAREDKLQDVADFIKAYKGNVKTIDRGLLIALASRAHEKAGPEFATFLDAVENDRPITI
jgi:hypothetical protein